MRPLTQFYLFVFFVVSIFEVTGQTCSDCRYISPIFDSVTVNTVQFGQGPRANGDMQDLMMDIYQPFGDTATNRAVAIFAFGGAFIRGNRKEWYVELVCDLLAKTGYVAVAIDYRIYDDIGGMLGEIFSLQHMRIFFRPMQDMRAAVQYIKADFSELGNNYRIDTSKILIGGASSGAMTSLMTAYCDKETELAEMGFGALTPIDALGGFYSTSGFYPGYSWKALATFNVAGSIVNSDWIGPGDIPLISAHGDADNVVPYKKGDLFGLPIAALTGGAFDMQGSYVVDSVARAKGVCSYLYTMEGKDHPTDINLKEYYVSVVHRLMLRMHAILNNRSFCCGLELNIQPADTLFYELDQGPVSLAASIKNDNGNAQVTWCGIACQVADSSPTIELEPDTSLHYIACVVYEDQCQAVALNMVREGKPKIIGIPSYQSGQEGVQLKVYPLPVTGTFTVSADFQKALNQELTIEIFDLAGKQVYSQQVFVANKLNQLIDVGELAIGNYLLKLTSPEIVLDKKLVIGR